MIWSYQKRFAPKKEDAPPPPQSGIGQYFFVFGSHFWKFVILNLLLLMFSLPIVTLPAALCGVNRVFIRLIRDGDCFLWHEFRKEFLGSFRKSIPPGLLIGVAFAVSYYLISLGLSNGQSIYGVLFLSLGFFVLIISVLLGSWTFVMIAMLPLQNTDILRNARALAGLEGKRDLMILGVHAVCLAFAFVFFPISLIPALLILLSFAQYTVCFIINSAVQERIIAPFEAGRQEEALSLAAPQSQGRNHAWR